MANLQQVNRGSDYITLRIANLTYPAQEYYLHIKNNSTGEESWDLGYGTSNYSDSYTFSNLSSDTSYSFTGRAFHIATSGQWVTFGGVFATTAPPLPSPPSSPSVYESSKSGKSITFQVIAPSNTTKLQYYTSWDNSYSAELGATAGNSYYPSYTVPEYNTAYYFQVRAGNAGGWSGWATRNFTSGSAPIPTAPSYAPMVASRVNGGFNLDIVHVDNATSYNIRVRQGSTTIKNVSTTQTTEILVNGLSYGESYTLDYYAINSTGSSGYSPSSTATTLPQTVQIVASPVGAGSLRVTLDSIPSGGWTDVEIERLDNNSSNVIDTKYITSSYIGWTGLPENVTYRFRARTRYYVNGTYLYSYSYSSVVSATTNKRPIDFAWTYTKSSGGDFNLRATEWNSLLDKINEFRLYRGLSQITSFIYASSGMDFSATMFNQAVNIIATLEPTTSPPSTKIGAQDVSDLQLADSIYASDLNLLVTSLNSTPNL